jgi:glycosyltransferase involved in cell wall biosynthesis
MKIIQILTHSPSWISKNIEDDIYDGWQTRTARAIQRQTDEFELECYVPEKQFHQIKEERKSGILYKTFPSTAITYGREISFPMIQAIKKMNGEKIILHLHGLHNYLTYKLCRNFRDKPIIIQHHGDCPPLNLIERRHALIPLTPILAIEQIMMNNALKFADYFFVLTERERQALLKLVKPEKVTAQGMGVDFNLFQPIAKTEARKRLNLLGSADLKILLYVGKLQKYKGCEIVIDIYKELRNKYNIRLLLVGGSEDDALYVYAKTNGAIIFPRQPNELLPDFYSAADVTLLPGTKPLNDWGGIGIALVESLACGTPVVAGTLKNFPGEIAKIGFMATTKNEIIDGIEFILKNPEKFEQCRDEAKKYFDWQVIAQNTISIYHQLAREYYGKNI